MHKTVSEQMPTTFLKASNLNPLHHTPVLLFHSPLGIWFSLIPLANNIIRQINLTESSWTIFYVNVIECCCSGVLY